ncbi:MAG: hypothetical protein JWP85_1212 [Rhodoglobus sp.]|nr:hypothetical protein [Rhodoglobus sp.]
MSSTARNAAFALGFVVVVLLSGCSFGSDTATGGGTGGTGQSGGSDAEDSTTEIPGDVDLGELEGLPESFPSEEIPIIDGKVELGVDLGTGWSLLIRVDDTEAAFADASAKLKAAGFEAVAEQSAPEGSFGVFENDKYQVQLTATDTPDGGPSANYVVVIKG